MSCYETLAFVWENVDPNIDTIMLEPDLNEASLAQAITSGLKAEDGVEYWQQLKSLKFPDREVNFKFRTSICAEFEEIALCQDDNEIWWWVCLIQSIPIHYPDFEYSTWMKSLYLRGGITSYRNDWALVWKNVNPSIDLLKYKPDVNEASLVLATTCGFEDGGGQMFLLKNCIFSTPPSAVFGKMGGYCPEPPPVVKYNEIKLCQDENEIWWGVCLINLEPIPEIKYPAWITDMYSKGSILSLCKKWSIRTPINLIRTGIYLSK